MPREPGGRVRPERPYRAPQPQTRRSPRRPRTLGDRLHEFVVRYGWRAYALPVLAVVSVAALLSTASSRPKEAAAAAPRPQAVTPTVTVPAVAPSHITLKDDATGPDASGVALKGYQLPAGAAYTMRGEGTFRVLPGTSAVVGSGPLYRYSIDVENGVDDVDLAQYEKTVVQVLSDKRSWSGHGVSLQRVDSGDIDFHVTLTSALTVRKYCGYTIHAESSCYAPAGTDGLPVNRVIFDDARWVRGSTAYVGDLAAYREYMINHEDGHALGHQHAHQCLPGGLAPAMMQQTFGLRSATTGKLCGANPWPYPSGVKGAPGKEAQDTDKNDEYTIGD